MTDNQKNAKRFSSLAAAVIASVRAAAGDYTGVAVQGVKHAKQIIIIAAAALFVLFLPLLMLTLSLLSIVSLSASTGGTSAGEYENVVTTTGLIGFIERHEGFSPSGMRGVDHQNVTIGYGHVDDTGQFSGKTITAKQADALLKSDLPAYEISVNKEFADTKLTQYQHDALVDFAYGLGPYIWPKVPRFVRDVKSGASQTALFDDFIACDFCNGAESKGLYNRRYDDWRLFVYGNYNCKKADGV